MFATGTADRKFCIFEKNRHCARNAAHPTSENGKLAALTSGCPAFQQHVKRAEGSDTTPHLARSESTAHRVKKQQHHQVANRSRSPAGPRRLGTATRISASLSRSLFAFFGSTPGQDPKTAKFAALPPGHAGFPKRAERSEGSDTTPVRSAPVSACKPLCAILLAKASVYPLLLVKANMGRLCEKLKNALKSGLEQRCNSNFLAIFVEVILWFFDRLRKAPALLAPEPSLSLTLQVQRKF